MGLKDIAERARQKAEEADRRRQKLELDPRGELGMESGMASGFASGSERGFRRGRGQMEDLAGMLRRRAEGQDSLSSEQLRQGLQQNMAAQRSMAASASPRNAAMAARTAAIQAGRLGGGMSGQAALAGIQERQAAEQGLGSLLGQMRQQDLQAALGARGQALQGYGGLEQQRTNRYLGHLGQPKGPSTEERLLGAGMGIAGTAAMVSDMRLKTDVEDAEPDVRQFMEAVSPRKYHFRPGTPEARRDAMYAAREGGGSLARRDAMYADRPRHVGIMAQDLERSPAGRQAVIETPRGKAVDVKKLSAITAGATGDLHKRTKALEEAFARKRDDEKKKKKGFEKIKNPALGKELMALGRQMWGGGS